MITGHILRKHMDGHTKKQVDFAPFAQHLENETLPDITPDDIGKYRLRLFLRRKFGAGYNGHPVAQAMLSHFDSSRKALTTVR